MKKRFFLFLIIVAAVALAGVTAATAKTDKTVKPRRILLVLLDKATWADIEDARTPFIDKLIRKGAAGLLSTHTAASVATTNRAYATLGAGNRAVGAIGSGLAFNVDERLEGEPVAQVYRSRSGRRPEGKVVILGMPALDRANANVSYGAVPASLGEALSRAGRKIGVYGNADTALKDKFSREAALIAGDRSGQVEFGDVGSSMVKKDAAGPFGLKTNYPRLLAALTKDWGRLDFAVVETGDGRRADQWQRYARPEVSVAQKRRSITGADRFLTELDRRVDLSKTLIIIASPSSPLRSDLRKTQQLTPIIMSGPGVQSGLPTSGSTRRPAVVTSTDVAPTILAAAGIVQPPAMTGRPITIEPGKKDVGAFITSNDSFVLADRLATPTIITFVVLQIAVLLLAAAVLLVDRPGLNIWRNAAQKLLLAVLAIPMALFAVPALPGVMSSVAAYILGVVVVTAALVGLAQFGNDSKFWPPLIIVGTTALFLAVNMAFGAASDLGSVLGYSPIVAGRFYGMGNQTMSVLVAAILLYVALVFEGRGGIERRDKYIVAGVFVLVTVVIGWPGLGANTGGTITAVVALVIAYMRLFHARVSWRQSALVAGAAIGVLGIFVLADAYLLPVQTHMGKTFKMVVDGGFEPLGQIIKRKAMANVRIYKYTSWSYLLTTIFALLAFVWWAQLKTVKTRFIDRYPYINSVLIASIIGGAVGAATNDSGISIPALMLGYSLLVIFYLLLDDAKGKEGDKAGE